jgi:two-component system cell cycle response regulator CtrA
VKAKLIVPKIGLRGLVMHIIVVEDDPIVAGVFGMTLWEAGYFKTTSECIESALFESKHNPIDAVLLDLNLPDGDGTRLARLIRKNHMPVLILVVSENSGIDDKITALGAGADGYLTKPFDRYELVANLNAIIRRTSGHSSATVNVGNLMADLSRNYAKIGDAWLDLTAKELRIIKVLALQKGAVLSNDAFLKHL